MVIVNLEKDFVMIQQPTLREMLDAGVHFGHKTSRWSPKMAPYIFIAKSGVHVINLEKTAEKVAKAAEFIAREAAQGKTFVFVGTKKQSGGIIKDAAISCSMPYVSVRWLGGTLTNFDTIKNSVKKFKQNREELENPNTGLSKSELSKIRREVEHGEKYLAGLEKLTRKPDALILFGSHDEKNAVKEAKVVGIPIIALVDTNADPTLVDYPVPANDDATKSVKLFADLFAAIINESNVSAKATAESAETKVADEKAKTK